MNEQVKFKIKKATLLELQKLAMRRGHTIEETLQHAVNTEFYMDERLRDGCKILCQDPEENLWKVVFSHMRSRE